MPNSDLYHLDILYVSFLNLNCYIFYYKENNITQAKFKIYFLLYFTI